MYKAFVTRIKTKPHPNADRLQLGEVINQQVIVSKDVVDGELGVFFPSGGQLSDQFCLENDLYPRYDENRQRLNAGYMDDNRRVRAVTLRGARSDGLWLQLENFLYLFLPEPIANLSEDEIQAARARLHKYFYEDLGEGAEFDSLFGIEICRKYVSRETLLAQARAERKARPQLVTFPQHADTENFLYYAQTTLEAGDEILVLEKEHGTSGRYAKALQPCTRQMSLGERIKSFFSGRFKEAWSGLAHFNDYRYTVGSRRMILASPDHAGSFYGDEKFRFDVMKHVDIPNGMIIYGEIVGYTPSGKPIMPPHAIPKELKAIRDTFGESVVYSYGNEPGECSFHVYRIAMADPDGNITDLSWEDVKRVCANLGLKTVREIAQFVFDGNTEQLLERLTKLVNGETGVEYMRSLIDARHFAEGIVLRVTKKDGRVLWFKIKNFIFRACEGHVSLDGVIDPEDAA